MTLATADLGRPAAGWRLRLYTIVFESDTEAGRRFDRWLIVLILFSVGVVMIDSTLAADNRIAPVFDVLEWFVTLVFTLEYAVRIACVRRPWRYVLSFYGIVDLLAILPTWLAILWPEAHALIDVRILRLLRVFRILKLSAFLDEYHMLGRALYASRRKILVFLSVVMMIVVVLGSLMYVVEGPEHGFSSVPTSIYWAITTLTTVGFGDITPQTGLGRLISSLMMLLGWGTLAVPTGIVTSELTAQQFELRRSGRACPGCGKSDHLRAAAYCQHCGTQLPPDTIPGQPTATR
ncbi:MAG: ion transporter [Rhodocyclaceae bacterium]|nr:ion transporter [Rhodocyclaceae bacterium]